MSASLQVNDLFDALTRQNAQLVQRVEDARQLLHVLLRVNALQSKAVDVTRLQSDERLELLELETRIRALRELEREEEPKEECLKCRKTFVYKKALARHQRTCGEPKKRFTCSQCAFQTISKQTMTDHANLHSREEPYACNTCSKHFRCLSSLQNHVRYVHSQHVHQCSWVGCEFETKFKNRLKVHENVHLDIKPWVCDWPGCDFRSSYQDKLKSHKCRHTGEKHFPCHWPKCLQRFRERSHLTVHMLKHTQEKPWICAICEQRFQTKQSMRQHEERRHLCKD